MILLPFFLPLAHAQDAPITGTLTVNSGDEYATSIFVSLELSCTASPSDCRRIEVFFENIEANEDPLSRDVIPEIVVTTSSFSSSFSAVETDIDTGIFFFGITNDAGTDPIFSDGDTIVVSQLPLDSIEGQKTVAAIYYDYINNATESSDSIILDTAPSLCGFAAGLACDRCI